MRNNLWLKEKLEQIHQTYFPDITDGNDIVVQFGRPSKTRLGSITIREKKYPKKPLTKIRLKFLNNDQVVSIITISGYFKDEFIPENVIEGILAHEFCHYVHGFNSMRQRLCRYPHAGGIIDHELKKRGMENIIKGQKKWIKKNWREYIKNF